jgi:DNA-binding NtrC family response regulator
MSSLRPASATAFATSGYCARPSEPESAAVATPSHILVADRNPAEYGPILDHLRQARPSVSIVEAADGPSALAALEAHPIGIALVDRCLPGLDGAKFANHLASRGRSILLGLLSDRLVPQWAKVARAIGAYDVLLKPIRSTQVDNLLAAYSRTCVPAKVLVVESSAGILDLIVRMMRLSRFDLKADLAATAADGLRMLVPGFYDLALVDVALADAGGVETAFQMVARSPSTKIVTFGKQDRFAPATLKSLGVAAHVSLPFQIHELDSAVHEAFDLWCPYVLKAIGKTEQLDQTGVDYLFKAAGRARLAGDASRAR